MSTRRSPSLAWRRVQAWLWTGPAGHLAGGALDLAQAFARSFARYLLARIRSRTLG